MSAGADTLLALAERCEKATGPDRELDKTIYAAVGGCNHERTERYICQSDSGLTCLDCGEDTYGAKRAPDFTSSLDAAMTLDAPGLAEFGGALAFLREALERIGRTILPDGKAALPRFLTAAFLRGHAALRARANQDSSK